MKKKYLIITIIVLGGLVWYIFLKPFDYVISFKANTFPGVINQSIKVWDKELKNDNLRQENLLHISQNLKFGDTTLLYDWKIYPLTDSTSKVKVRIKDLNHSILNKIQIPFKETILEKRSKKNMLSFIKKLNDHIKNFKVQVVGKDTLKSVFCAYLPIEGTQLKKANGMMINYPYLSSFVKENGLGNGGFPFVEITDWNINSDSISYNFCYPINYSDSLPKHKEIRYKNIASKKALKAIYNGNYITSDRAWYKLLDYADKNGIEVEKTPVEFFYDNPNLGGNELDWKAEIFLPIKIDD